MATKDNKQRRMTYLGQQADRSALTLPPYPEPASPQRHSAGAASECADYGPHHRHNVGSPLSRDAGSGGLQEQGRNFALRLICL